MFPSQEALNQLLLSRHTDRATGAKVSPLVSFKQILIEQGVPESDFVDDSSVREVKASSVYSDTIPTHCRWMSLADYRVKAVSEIDTRCRSIVAEQVEQSNNTYRYMYSYKYRVPAVQNADLLLAVAIVAPKIDGIGFRLYKATLYSGTTRLDTVHGQWYHLATDAGLPASLPAFETGGVSCLLPFYISNGPEFALPLCALAQDRSEISVEFSFATRVPISSSTAADVLATTHLFAKYGFLINQRDRQHMTTKSHVYYIDQVLYSGPVKCGGRRDDERLYFDLTMFGGAGLCKSLLWVCTCWESGSIGSWLPILITGRVCDDDMLIRNTYWTSLELRGGQRRVILADHPSSYFKHLQPYMHKRYNKGPPRALISLNDPYLTPLKKGNTDTVNSSWPLRLRDATENASVMDSTIYEHYCRNIVSGENVYQYVFDQKSNVVDDIRQLDSVDGYLNLSAPHTSLRIAITPSDITPDEVNTLYCYAVVCNAVIVTCGTAGLLVRNNSTAAAML